MRPSALSPTHDPAAELASAGRDQGAVSVPVLRDQEVTSSSFAITFMMALKPAGETTIIPVVLLYH